jgi:predicted NACHT family NTPase
VNSLRRTKPLQSHPPSDPEITCFVTYVKQVKKGVLPPGKVIPIIAVRENSDVGVRSLSGFSIQICTEGTLLDDLVDFTDYFQFLARRVEREHLPDSEKTLEMVYAPSACAEEGTNEMHSDVESVLESWLYVGGQRQFALLGEYGQGKSTTALMFAHHLVRKWNEEPPRVPIIIELRGRSPRNTTPEGLVSE